MKLYLKAVDSDQLAAADSLLGGQESRLRELLRVGRAAGQPDDPELRVNMEATAQLYEQRSALFFDSRELRLLVKGVYFGSDTCSHLLPTMRGLAGAQKICAERRWRLVLLLPPVPELQRGYALQLLESLAPAGGEVVVNDLGMLRAVQRHQTLQPVLGRLFHKTRRNAFLDRLQPTEVTAAQLAAQQGVLQESEYALPQVRQLWRNNGVSRAGVENLGYQLAGLAQKPRLHIDLYYPWCCLSVGRGCDIAALSNHENASTPQRECRALCRSHGIGYPDSGIFGLYQRRNAIYKPQLQLALHRELCLNDRNRLIFEAWL